MAASWRATTIRNRRDVEERVASARFIVVVSLVIGHEGAVLLARRHPERDHAPGAWDAISRRLEAGESSHQAARREGFEETGVR